MERKIGEIFEYNGEWYQCGEGRCRDCYFSEERYLCKQFITKGFCTSGIIYKKLEKVGEPYTHYCPSGRIIYFQRYKLFYKLYSHNTEYIMCDFNEDGIVSIEIKQTKEDMEESVEEKLFCDKVAKANAEYMKVKLNSSLKPFDLEAAKQGKPVCTRDGCKARIICFDAKGKQPIIALLEREKTDEEIIQTYSMNGRYYEFRKEDHRDLMMLPEKKEGWINISSCPDNGYSNYDSGVIVFKTKEEAVNFTNNKDYIDTVKVTWEEQLWDWISNYTLEI